MHEKLNFDAADSIETPIGPISVYAKGNALVYLRMTQPAEPKYGESAVVEQALTQLSQFFKGERKEFSVPMQATGTEFQKAVWDEIAKIPFGETRSYGQIAQNIGNPAASRAVGGAVGANPFAIIVPCHRVMGASGKITGFSGGEGIPTKRWLLKFEDIESVD